MLEVKIGLDGVPSPTKVTLGNRWENNDEQIYFNLPQEFDSYNKYVIAVMKQSSGNQTVVLPIASGNIFTVSSDLTYLNGNWNMYVMCRQQALDLDKDTVDIGANNDEHVFISDGFIGTVNKNMIEEDAIENVALDTNLQIVYDELFALKKNILDQINGNNSVITSYKDLTDKPTINGVELDGNKSLYDFNLLPIHVLNAKSFSALYKAIKTTGLSLDEEDISMFLFAFTSNEIETTYEGKFFELNIYKIYKAEYNPFTKTAYVSCDDFLLTVKAEGIVGCEFYSNASSGTVDESLLDSKLDIDQGVENAGMVVTVGDDGKITLSDPSTIATVDSEELDNMLEEVFGNG